MTRGEDQSDLGGLDRSDMNWVEDEMAQAESRELTHSEFCFSICRIAQ